MRLAAAPESWLQLTPPADETLRFSLKGPLYAASAVFKRSQRNNMSVVEAHGEAKLRVPFMKEKSFSYGIASEATAPSEFQQRENEYRWVARADYIQLNEPAARFVRRADFFMPAPELIFALQGALELRAVSSYGAIFPAGRRLQGCWIERKSAELYEGRLTKLEAPTEASYLEAVWPEKNQFALTVSRGAITAIRFKLPLFGHVELRRD